MTRAEIRAELRRSACEDRDPLDGVSLSAFVTALHWICEWEAMSHMRPSELRLFFLLIAEAM